MLIFRNPGVHESLEAASPVIVTFEMVTTSTAFRYCDATHQPGQLDPSCNSQSAPRCLRLLDATSQPLRRKLHLKDRNRNPLKHRRQPKPYLYHTP